MLPTFSQLSNNARNANPYTLSRSTAFQGAPHSNGIIYKITTMSPRKPNSASRTFAKVKLIFNENNIFANIPGIGEHKLQQHGLVLVSGHGPKDSPGINYHLISGILDFHFPESFMRSNSSSKFGAKPT